MAGNTRVEKIDVPSLERILRVPAPMVSPRSDEIAEANKAAIAAQVTAFFLEFNHSHTASSTQITIEEPSLADAISIVISSPVHAEETSLSQIQDTASPPVTLIIDEKEEVASDGFLPYPAGYKIGNFIVPADADTLKHLTNHSKIDAHCALQLAICHARGIEGVLIADWFNATKALELALRLLRQDNPTQLHIDEVLQKELNDIIEKIHAIEKKRQQSWFILRAFSSSESIRAHYPMLSAARMTFAMAGFITISALQVALEVTVPVWGKIIVMALSIISALIIDAPNFAMEFFVPFKNAFVAGQRAKKHAETEQAENPTQIALASPSQLGWQAFTRELKLSFNKDGRDSRSITVFMWTILDVLSSFVSSAMGIGYFLEMTLAFRDLPKVHRFLNEEDAQLRREWDAAKLLEQYYYASTLSSDAAKKRLGIKSSLEIMQTLTTDYSDTLLYQQYQAFEHPVKSPAVILQWLQEKKETINKRHLEIVREKNEHTIDAVSNFGFAAANLLGRILLLTAGVFLLANPVTTLPTLILVAFFLGGGISFTASMFETIKEVSAHRAAHPNDVAAVENRFSFFMKNAPTEEVEVTPTPALAPSA